MMHGNCNNVVARAIIEEIITPRPYMTVEFGDALRQDNFRAALICFDSGPMTTTFSG
jgi:hypothetical protein